MTTAYSIHNRAGRLIVRSATLDEVLDYLNSYSKTAILNRIIVQTKSTGICVDGDLFLEVNQ